MVEIRASSVLTANGVRRAESQDVDAIIDLCWSNAIEGEFKKKIKFNRVTLRMFVGALLADDKACVLIYERDGAIKGVFAFTTFPNFYYFAGEVVASMVVWSVAPRFRGLVSLLLKENGERVARELGAKYMILSGASKYFASLCNHCGYSFLESSYIKELA